LASVTQIDLARALSTMDISNADRAILEKRNGACGPGLAWVRIARPSGQSLGKIRLQSGSYFSPLFPAGDMPVRVAILYLAPYAAGHGVLAAFRITPHFPSWSGWAALTALLRLANFYVGARIIGLWPKFAGTNDRSFRVTAARDGAAGLAMEELRGMIGLVGVKAEMEKLVERLKVEAARREAGLLVAPISLHMVFAGPPGVGRTFVARLYGAVLRDLGVLEKGHLVETDRLVAGYVGQTALKAKQRIAEALDGVLFIDEAYALASPTGYQKDQFGQEAIDTLIKEMEGKRDRLVVIVAGYSDKMQEFLCANPGLPSRFTKTIEFPPYDADDLLTIMHGMATNEGLMIEPASDVSLRRYFVAARERPDFGNARSARTLLERAPEAQAMRLGPLLASGCVDLITLLRMDIETAITRTA
jgi:stage V sporulation protein K